MKFFKHFTDAHNGTLVNSIMAELGHTGHSCYWILVEIAAAKMEKNREETWTEEHCVFKIHARELRRSLQITHKKVESFLRVLSKYSALTFEKHENTFKISMPKLLESLDRDALRARPARGRAAPRERERTYMSTYTKKERENKKDVLSPSFSALVAREEKISGERYEHDGAGERAANWFAEKYCYLVPGSTQGNYDFIFKQQIKTAGDKENLSAAIENYCEFIRGPAQRERPPKASLASFLSVRPENPWTWKDFIKASLTGKIGGEGK